MKKGIISVVSFMLALTLMLVSIPVAYAANATIALNGNSISVSGDGVTVEGSIAVISEAGVYTVSGTLNNGRILVNAKGCEVKIILNGVNITCSYGSPIYIFKASAAEISLVEGKENILTDGEVYTYEDNYSSASEQEPNACLYSKADLTVSGSGKLTVNANHNNGITSKDTLTVNDAQIEVTAVGNGINGKDSFFARNASFTVNATGGDALRSTQENDPSLGWITLNNCTTNLTAANDGIQSETGIIISGGEHYITTGGGHTESVVEGESAKGVKSGTTLSLNAEYMMVSAAEDAIHAGGDITVTDGEYVLASGDDGIHSDAAAVISGGDISITSVGKGLDADSGTTQNGGCISIITPDSSIFDISAGFTVNGGEFLGFSGKDTVLQPSENSQQASFGVLLDSAVQQVVINNTHFNGSDIKYILVSNSQFTDIAVLQVGEKEITVNLTEKFTLYRDYNTEYTRDEENMTLLGVKAETPASAIGMTVYRDGAALADNAVVATGDTVNIGGKEYTVIIKGDVSRDGKVNSTDFMQIRKQYLGLYEMDEIQKSAANVDGDDGINSTDFMRIRRHFLGIFDLYA